MMTRTLLSCVLAAAAAALTAPASAVFLSLSHSYGEFVDRGVVLAEVSPDDGSRIDCGAGLVVSRNGNRIELTARRLPGAYVTGECFRVTANLGTLAAGTYEIEARLAKLEPGLFDVQAQTLVVLPLEGRCNADPLLRPSIIAVHRSLTPAQLATKVATDAQYAERLLNPLVEPGPSAGVQQYAYLTYPPLLDVTVATAKLVESEEFLVVSRNGWACFSAAPPDTVATFVEFYHAGLDHYFYSGDAKEIAAIDAGKVGTWTRTGLSFSAVQTPGCQIASYNSVVYRFFGVPGKGPSSHFFTRDRAECYAVDKSGQWGLEGVPFYAGAPASDGTCATAGGSAHVPLYRVWRPFGDSNHRFTTSRAVVAQMTAKGWVDEGAAMCVLESPP